MPSPFVPPAIPGTVSTATPANIHSMFPQVIPGPIPSRPVPPIQAPTQPTTSQFPDALHAMTLSQQPEQPAEIAGMQFQH